MIEELEARGLTGIQANVKSIVNNTYWEKGMEYSIELDNIGYIRDSSEMVIGMPCLYKLDVLKEINFDKNIGAADDTDLCYRLGKAGHKLGISTAICYQKHRANFKSTVKKFLWYGEGDCEFGLKHKDRFWSIYSHPIRNYFFKKSFLSIRNGKPYYVPYFMLVGIFRHIGFYKFLFKNKFGSGIDSRTLNKHDKDY
jgi:GT2 family glycosyltransferase